MIEDIESAILYLDQILEQYGVFDEQRRSLQESLIQLHQPCVLAIVGKMKAGKSTFVNSLLGHDLAKVGVTETTATINRFVYGVPNDPSRPVRCVWENGRVTQETTEYLNSLQGNDLATLERAKGIKHLEYRLNLPMLESLTIVDTPGTQAAVNEHQNETAEFLGLRNQLRDKHNRQTDQLNAEADAIVYLVGHVGRAEDKELLEEFRFATSGQTGALNAVGVVAKIDMNPEALERRVHLAQRVAEQMNEVFNTVVPVSAGLQNALRGWREGEIDWYERIMDLVSNTDNEILTKMMRNDRAFLRDRSQEECPSSSEWRKELLGETPWRVFATIVKEFHGEPELVKAMTALEEIAGFNHLKTVLEQCFFNRGRMVKARKVLRQVIGLMGSVFYEFLPQLERKVGLQRVKLDRLQRVLINLPMPDDDRAELEEILQTHFDASVDPVALRRDLEFARGRLENQEELLMEEHSDHRAILDVQQWGESEFTVEERKELMRLLGLYGTAPEIRLAEIGLDMSAIEALEMKWRNLARRARGAVRKRVLERAAQRCYILAEDIDSQEDAGYKP